MRGSVAALSQRTLLPGIALFYISSISISQEWGSCCFCDVVDSFQRLRGCFRCCRRTASSRCGQYVTTPVALSSSTCSPACVSGKIDTGRPRTCRNIPSPTLARSTRCTPCVITRRGQIWNEDVIEELKRAKMTILGRDTRLRRAQAACASSDDDDASLASSMDSSLGGPMYVGGGIAVDRKTGRNKERGSGKGHRSSGGGAFSAEPRWSRFAFSLTIPRPKQHNGLTAADVADSRSGEDGGEGIKGEGDATNKASNKGGNRMPSSKSNHDWGGGGHTNATSSSPNEQGKAQGSSPGAPAAAAAAAAGAATWGSKLRLDIVRADAERSVASPRSPRPGTEGGGGGSAGTAAASARFDSPARDLLQGYEDEQVRIGWIDPDSHRLGVRG